MNRPTLLLLLALPSAAIAALGPRYGGDLRVGVLDLPVTTEPGPPRGTAESLVAGLVHETLVGVGPDGLPVPALARGWSTAASGREWMLHLREATSFHDERPVGSEDAVRSLKRFLRAPSTAAARLAEALEGGSAYRSGDTEELPGLLAPGPLSLVLRLPELRPLPLAPLASPAAAVISASGAGCGPFVPTVRAPGRRLGLVPFGDHVRGRPYLNGLELATLADGAALRSEWQAGRIDLAPGEGGPGALAATLLLVLDPARPPFTRVETRAAVAAALERADLVRQFLPGGEASASLLAPTLLPPLGIEAPPMPGTLAASAAMTVSRDVAPLVSQRIVACLGAIGLDVAVTPASPAAAREARSPARLLFWTPEVAEPSLALEELAGLAPPDVVVRTLLATAAHEADADRRRLLLHRAEAALRAGHVLVPLALAPVSFSARRGVHGASVDARGRLVLEDAWVEP